MGQPQSASETQGGNALPRPQVSDLDGTMVGEGPDADAARLQLNL